MDFMPDKTVDNKQHLSAELNKKGLFYTKTGLLGNLRVSAVFYLLFRRLLAGYRLCMAANFSNARNNT